MNALLALLVLAAGDPTYKETVLFKPGDGGYKNIKVPGIVATSKGTLLAYCEARKIDLQNRFEGLAPADWNPADIWMRRSTDGGRTWEAARIIVTAPTMERNATAVAQKWAEPGGTVAGSPVAIADRKTGAVHFLYCVEFSRCFYMRSEDEGKTFSPPVEITPVFEKFKPDYDWKMFATGPGHGIQLKNGRLLVPVWLANSEGGFPHLPSEVSVIFSDDAGKTWNRGALVPRDGKVLHPSETTAVELADGRVMLNMRTETTGDRRAFCVSADGATGWGGVRFHPHLLESRTMGSLVRLSQAPGKNRILFCNNSTTSWHHNMTDLVVKLSYDEGETWPVFRQIDGRRISSDLAVGTDGMIHCVSEALESYDSRLLPDSTRKEKTLSLRHARFNLEWLSEGKDKLEAGAAAAATGEKPGAKDEAPKPAAPAPQAAPDTVVLKDGSKVTGKIIARTADLIMVRDAAGKLVKIETDKIAEINPKAAK
jgi:sialidase-1